MGEMREAVMSGQYTDFRNSRAIVGVAAANIVLATLIYEFGGTAAQGCGLLTSIAWAALELVRSVLLLSHWAAASAYLYDGSRLVQHLVEMGASVVPLACALAR
jgi:hypothetical protein